MADFSKGPSDYWKNQARNPAAPMGLRQASASTAQDLQEWDGQGPKPWTPESMLDVASSWYTGANSQGMENGWNTEFMQKAFDQMNRYYALAAEQQDQSVWFTQFDPTKNPTATGVVMWDDPQRGLNFGDVFVDGVKQEGQNLYQAFDKRTADVMMAEFMLDGPEKTRLFEQIPRGNPDAVGNRVQELRTQNSETAATAITKGAFKAQTDARELEYQQGWQDPALIAGGAAGGALMGAGIGSFGGPVGTLIGGAVGGIVGGVSSWLNQDELRDLAARSAVVSQMANERYQGTDQVGALGVTIKEFSGLGMRLISPMSNTVRGIEDARRGDVGDMTAEWYEFTPDGDRQRSNWVTGLDLAASVADSALQFSSGAGRAAYMGVMGATTAGGVAGMIPGEGFNYSTGEFDAYENAGEWMAAAGSVAIDAVQMGGAGAFVRAARNSRVANGMPGRASDELLGVVPPNARGQLRQWAGDKAATVTAAAGDAVEKVAGKRTREFLSSRFTDEGEVIAGRRYIRDADGNMMKPRLALEMLAPSEMLRAIPVSYRARTRAADPMNVTPDDMYNAALELTRYNGQFRNAAIMGYAEGTEELVQGILDPLAYSENINPGQVLESAMYGFAGGLGMGMGSMSRTANYQQQVDARARVNWAIRSGKSMPNDEQWAQIKEGMRPVDIEKLAMPTPEEDEQLAGLREVATEAMRQSGFTSPIAMAVFDSLREGAWEKFLAGKNTVGGQSRTLFGSSDNKTINVGGAVEELEMAPNSAVMSFDTTIDTLVRNAEGLRTKMTAAMQGKAKYEAIQQNAASTQEQKDEAARMVAKYDAQILDLGTGVQVADMMVGTRDNPAILLQMYQDFLDDPDAQSKIQRIKDFNAKVKSMYEGQWEDNGQLLPGEMQDGAKKLVETLMTRHPLIDTGSWGVFVPMVSVELSRANAHGAVFMHQATLKAMGADHDGDNAVQAQEQYFTPEQLRNLRRGVQYLQQENAQFTYDPKKPKAPKTKWKVVADPPDAEATFIRNFSDPMLTTKQKDIVTQGLQRLMGRLRDRYATNGPFDFPTMDNLLSDFEANVRAGNVNARVRLVEAMFEAKAQELFAMSDTTNIPEFLQIWSMVNLEWDAIQQNFAYDFFLNREQMTTTPDVPARPEDDAALETRARRQAVVHGHALAMLGTADPVRAAQYLHYSALLKSAVSLSHLDPETLSRSDQRLDEFTRAYAQIGTGDSRSDMDKFVGVNAIESRVIAMLEGMLDSADLGNMYPDQSADLKDLLRTGRKTELMLMLANVRVPDMIVDESNDITFGNRDVTLLQLLLRKSLEIEKNLNRDMDQDKDLIRKIRKLERLTRPETDGHSSTAALATMEVFGNTPLATLVGDASMYVGPQMTLAQYQKKLLAMSSTRRREELALLKRAPHYFLHKTVGDPPWYLEQLYAQNVAGQTRGAEVNAFTMLVDALQTATSVENEQRRHQSNRDIEAFESGLLKLSEVLDAWNATHGADIPGSADGSSDRVEILRHMLRYEPRAAQIIAEVIPQESRLGVIEERDGQVTMQNWVEQVLTEKDEKKAAVQFYVYSKLAEWNVLQGTLDVTALHEEVRRIQAEERDDKGNRLSREQAYARIDLEQFRSRVRLGQVKSRFLQTLWHLNMIPDGGRELHRFLATILDADDLSSMFDRINEEPMWLQGRAKLYAFNDSVEAFELNPNDVWTTDATGTEYREALGEFSESMSSLADRTAEQAANAEQNLRAVKAMQEVLRKLANGEPLSDGFEQQGALLLQQLEKAIQVAREFPDAIGRRARDQAMAAFQTMYIRMHDKGKADPRIAPLGSAVMTADTIGFGDPLQLEMGAITSFNWSDVSSNLSALAKGPVRIMLDNGKVLDIDMSTLEGAVEMLADPLTQPFAMAVLFPTVRDVNSQNTVSTYQSTMARSKPDPNSPKGEGNLAQMLAEVNFANLFNPPNQESRVDQAYRYIGHVEAYIRRAALDTATTAPDTDIELEELEFGYYPIQNMLNSFLVAYQTTAGRGRTDEQNEKIRDELVVAVADMLKMLSTKSDFALDTIKQELVAVLQARFWQDDTMVQVVLDREDPLSDAVADYMMKAIEGVFIREKNEATARFQAALNQGVPQATAVAQYQQELADITTREDEFNSSGSLQTMPYLARDFSTVGQMFAMTHDPADAVRDMQAKVLLVSFLGKQDRINKLQGVKAAFTIEDHAGAETDESFAALIDKFRETVYDKDFDIADMANSDPLQPNEWNQLRLWATQQFISERVVASSADMSMAAIILGKNEEEIRRLYDTSWSYLVDTAFDKRTLAAARRLAELAQHRDSMDSARVRDTILNRLFPDRLLGTWNDRVPIETLKAKKVLDGAAVKESVAAAGIAPKEMDAWIAGEQTTFLKPTAEHFTEASLVVADGSDIQQVMDVLNDAMLGLKTHNHFVRAVELIPTDTALPPENLFGIVTEVDDTNDETENSGLQLFKLEQLLDHMMRRVEQGEDSSQTAPSLVQGFTLRIEYVDVDKQPDGRDWANNRFFEGRGRNATGRNDLGPITALYFGTGGLSKLWQQSPLDSLTKKGQAFRAFLQTALDHVRNSMENKTTVTEVMQEKTLHLMGRRFGGVMLQWDDMPAIYKYVKSRHVMVGRNRNTGKKEVWRVEKYMEMEARAATDPNFVFELEALDGSGGPAELVALSHKVAQTLKGRPGVGGVAQDAQYPYTNVSDADPFPSYDMGRLEQLGLAEIGEKAKAKESPAGRHGLLTKAYGKGGPTRKGVRSLYQARIDRLITEERLPQLEVRSNYRSQDQGKLDIAETHKWGMKVVGEMLRLEALGERLNKLGIPNMLMKDLMQLESSERLYHRLFKDLDPNSMVWQHKQDETSGDPTRGLISPVEVREGFPNTIQPVIGDIVVLDLTSFMNNTGQNEQEAIDQAKQVIDVYVRKGVSIVLGGTTSVNGVRQALVEHLTFGSMGYKRKGMSGHIFEPISDDWDVDLTEQALDSTLSEVTAMSAANTAVTLVTDEFSALSEGTRLIWMDQPSPWQQFATVLIPTQFLLGASDDHVLSFGLPQHGTGQADQFGKVAKKIIDYAATQEGFDDLLDMMGRYDPMISLYQQTADGYIAPGVRPPEEALKLFIAALKQGGQMIDPGSTAMAGDLYMTVDSENRVLINRIGFSMPDETQRTELLTAWAEPAGGNAVIDLRIAFGPSTPENLQTVPPPFFIDSQEYTRDGLTVQGTYNLFRNMKITYEGQGGKTTTSPVQDGLRVSHALSDNGVGVSSMVSTNTSGDKSVVKGLVTNFADLFMMTGVDFRHLMVDYFYGPSKNGPLTNRPEDDFEAKWTTVQVFLDRWSKLESDMTATQVAKMLDFQNETVAALQQSNEIGAALYTTDWLPRIAQQGSTVTPQDRVAHILLMTLLIPGITPNMVMSNPGLLSVKDPKDKTLQIRRLPPVMTQAFNDVSMPEMRQMLIDWANESMSTHVDSNGDTYRSAWFDSTFRFNVVMEQVDPNGDIQQMVRRGYAQLETLVASDENPVTLAFAHKNSRSMSMHNARVAAAQGGSVVIESKPLTKDNTPIPTVIDEVYGDNTVIRFDEDQTVLWDLVTRIMPDTGPVSPAKYMTPMEGVHYKESVKEQIVYQQPVDKDGWDGTAVAEAIKFLKYLNMDSRRDLIEVDYLVRQWYGAPGPREDQKSDWIEQITEKDYLEAVTAMMTNVEKKMHPLHNGMVPLEHSAFWTKLYKAQQGARKPWAPLRKNGRRKRVAAFTLDEWTTTLLGQVFDSYNEFQAIYRTALDGFWRTYQGITPTFAETLVSLDKSLSLKLLDPDTNRQYLSIDPSVRALMHDPPIYESMKLNWRTLSGHDPVVDRDAMDGVTESSWRHYDEKRKAWIRKNGVTKQQKTSMIDYARQGATYQESVKTTNSFFRNVYHVSIVNRLFNPALWTSAMFEVFFYNQLEKVTDVVAGTDTGWRGKMMAAASETSLGKLMGLTPRYTVADYDPLERIIKRLGSSVEWAGEVFGEITFSTMVEPGAHIDEEGQLVYGASGRFGRLLERMATGTARTMNDPRLGMRQTSAARRYIGAALEYLEMTNNLIPLETLATLIEQDPLWLQKNFPDTGPGPHRMGLNAVAHIRSTKNSALAKGIMSPIDTLTNAENVIVNGIGYALKIPFAFTRFNATTFMNLTGLSGMDQAVAMMLGGRQKPAFMRKVGAFSRGENYKPDTVDTINMDDVIETLDLSRLFLRGLVTQTGLMAMGFLGANLFSLGGETDEERRRRKIAQFLDLPRVYDPRELQNDFRQADAIFVDNIPVLNRIFYNEDTGRSTIVPHWMIQQFTSPIMGMTRFFETGDVRNIAWGFLDAISVLPTSAIRLWHDADLTATLLMQDAQALAGENADVARDRAMWTVINVVGLFERALVENQFINALRNAGDPLDRNPYAVPDTTKLGQVIKIDGEPVSTDALKAYVSDRNGQPQAGVGYDTRTGWNAALHQYAENNLMAALGLSLFSGQLNSDSTFFRENMVPRGREVPVERTVRKDAEATLLARWKGAGGMPFMTKEEIIKVIKNREESAGRWWKQDQVEAEADAVWKAMKNDNATPTFIDKNSREILNDPGATGIIKSLMAGVVDFSDPALQGIYITQEMRDRIGQQWLEELVQEGVDYGLSYESAQYRARRFWYGDPTRPDTPGLRELLYSKQIPDRPTANYTQLNVRYTIGPDGKPWATPYARNSFLGTILPVPTGIKPAAPGMRLDERGNSVDEVRGINTGLAALKPNLVESQIEANDKPLERALAKRYTPSQAERGNSYGGFRRGYYRSGGWGGGGGWGGYSSSGGGGAYFTRTNPYPRRYGPNPNGIPAINSNTPYVRRASIRRERFSSERGRLKQWQ